MPQLTHDFSELVQFICPYNFAFSPCGTVGNYKVRSWGSLHWHAIRTNVCDSRSSGKHTHTHTHTRTHTHTHTQ